MKNMGNAMNEHLNILMQKKKKKYISKASKLKNVIHVDILMETPIVAIGLIIFLLVKFFFFLD